MNNLISIILAAGQGARMKSELPKVLHEINGKTLIEYSVETIERLVAKRIIVVVGHKEEMVREVLMDRVEYVTQAEQLGTGHAVQQAKKLLADYDGYIMVSNGDMPFLTQKMFTELYQACQEQEADAALLTVKSDDLADWGRVVRADDGDIKGIVEAKDASPEIAASQEKNVGLYCFKAQPLWAALQKVKAENKQSEYYLTDVIGIMGEQGQKVVSVTTDDYDSIVGINSQKDLVRAQEIIKGRRA
ncbi:MAG: NTP transferase domain-containing protein [Parcubacteria group bacterium]|nr:NTP transferase domain-containing protein [Parcubacteria group bacterium]